MTFPMVNRRANPVKLSDVMQRVDWEDSVTQVSIWDEEKEISKV